MNSIAFGRVDGEMNALIRAHDWFGTPLGEAANWPQPLKTLVDVMLAAKQPMFVAWGPEHNLLYNDGYVSILARRHPSALGRPFFEVWPETHRELAPLFGQVMAGEPVHMDDITLLLDRPGRPREAHFAFSYTPVRDEEGTVLGLFCPCTETTDQVLTERRLYREAERQQRLFEQAPGFITILRGPEHVFEFVNDAYARLFGHRGFLGQTARTAFPELEGQGFFEVLDRVYRTGERFIAHHTRIRLQASPDVAPTEHVLDFIYEPVIDDTGQVTGIFCEGHAVTEAHLAHEALRESEARLQFLDRLGTETGTLTDADAILAKTTQMLGEHLNLSVCAYADMDADQDGFTIRGDWAAPGCTSIVGHYSLAAFGKLAVKNLGADLPLIVNDNLRELAPEEAATFQNIGIAATICMPLVKAGRLTALMAIHDRVPRVWTGAELSLLREVTARSWAHIERVGAVAELRALNADLERQVIERTQARGRSWQVSPDLMGALNSEGYFETSNPAWRTMLGWSEAEVAQLSLWEMLHPDDLERTRAGFALTQIGQPAIQFSNRYRCKDGSYRWISWVGVPEDGMVYCTGRDITEEQAQGAELAKRTAERNRLWTLSEDMLARADYEGRMSAVSPAWTRVLGYTESELLTRPYAEIIHPEDVQATVGGLSRMAETGEPTRFHNRILSVNGQWKPIEWTVAPEPGGVNFIAIGRDMTSERDAAIELERAQDALRQSQKMEAMGQLTGGVAHDFNNLLTPIVGSLDMLQRRGIGGPREQRLIDGAMQSAERAKTLVQRLLAFARRQPLQPSAVDVGKLVTGMADLVASTSGPQIHVVVEAADDLPAAIADQNQLEMALLNLSVNARDAMPDGGTLRITADEDWVGSDHWSKLRAGRYIHLSVSDTGLGMDEATLRRAIEPFFSTKGLGKGTGLGLSMVHGLVSQLSGALSIKSRPGLGTNIEMWLPTSAGPAEIIETVVEDLPARSTRGTALLVDDEDLVRMSTADMLSELGYEVVEAKSAEEALRVLRDGLKPDLLVTDHLMPGMNGTDLARAFQTDYPGRPILIVSGYAEAEGVAPDLPRLTKPFRSTDLENSLART